jgi:pimeloyl-ACP methyl ester carboxylesterase
MNYKKGIWIMKYFEYDGIRFHYEDVGEGMPVVFCHGLGGDMSQPQELIGSPSSFRLITWDARGHGQTKPISPDGKFNFDTFADDLRYLLGHLGINRAVVGGISMGAGVAAAFAYRYPESIRAIILVRPAWLVEPMPNNLELFPQIGELLGQGSPEPALARFDSNFKQALDQIRSVSPPVADSLREQFTKPLAAERRGRLMRMPNSSPLQNWSEVEKLDVPALVIGTNQDPVHPWSYAEQWAEHLNYAELVKIVSKAEDPEAYRVTFRKAFYDFLPSLIGVD